MTIDLLSNGYAVISPSNTRLEPDGGGPYRWIDRHSPFDITLAELEPLPDRLVDFWLARAGRPRLLTSTIKVTSKTAKAWELVKSPISEGGRNESLTRIAGWLRQYHPAPIVESLLLAINEARCKPPLPEQEVSSIVQSVVRYPQHGVNGHPRALVNRWKGE